MRVSIRHVVTYRVNIPEYHSGNICQYSRTLQSESLSLWLWSARTYANIHSTEWIFANSHTTEWIFTNSHLQSEYSWIFANIFTLQSEYSPIVTYQSEYSWIFANIHSQSEYLQYSPICARLPMYILYTSTLTPIHTRPHLQIRLQKKINGCAPWLLILASTSLTICPKKYAILRKQPVPMRLS